MAARLAKHVPTRYAAAIKVLLGPTLVALAVGVQLWYLAPLWNPGEPLGEDLSLHFAEAAHLGRAIAAGDFNWWNPMANLGFPSGLYYQVLPQLIPALAWLLCGRAVALLILFKLAIVVPVALLPVAVYRAFTISGHSKPASIGSSLAVGLAFAKSNWGAGIDSLFTTGLYTQAWAMLFFPLAMAYGNSFVEGRGNLTRALCYTLLVGLCHPLVGMAVMLAILPALLRRTGLWDAAKRAVLFLALTLVTSSFFWLPILIYYDSFGGFPTRLSTEEGMRPFFFLLSLAQGTLLDYGRPRVLTILVFLGISTQMGRAPMQKLVTIAATLACLVASGSLVGHTYDNLLPLTRFLGPLQVVLACFAGATAGELADWFWQRASRSDRAVSRMSAYLAIVIALSGIAGTAVWGGKQRAQAEVQLVHQLPEIGRSDLDPLMDRLSKLPSGRVLASAQLGTGSHWWMYLPFVVAEQPVLRAYGGAALQSSASYVYLTDESTLVHSDLYNNKYFLAKLGAGYEWLRFIPGLEEVMRSGRHVLYQAPTPGNFQPIRILGTIPPYPKTNRMASVMKWLHSRTPGSPERLEIGYSRGVIGGDLQAVIVDESSRPSLYAAQVWVGGSASATVGLAVTYHPLWSARIDSSVVPVRRVFPDTMAVDVPPGKHQVEFLFRRPFWIWLLLFAALGSVLLLAILEARLNPGFLDRSGRGPAR